jgi:drug/metabolite transporter (DMT)-like permease
VIASLGGILALLSSLLLSLGGWMQWRGLRRIGRNLSLLRLVRDPFWDGGIAASSLGTVAYHGALLLAPLTLVQPLSSLHVGFTALLSWKGRRVRIREWLALGLCVAGTLLLALDDRAPVSSQAHWAMLWCLCAVGAAPILLPPPSRLAGFWPALRAGLCYGLSAILWKAGMDLPYFGLAWSFVMALFAAGFFGGFAFLQAAFRRLDAGTANALAASVAALFPLPAGLLVFGETASLWACLAAPCTVAGVALLGCCAPNESSETDILPA